MWGRRICPAGSAGCSKGSDRVMPRRCITACERRLSMAVKATISRNSSLVKATSKTVRAASVAKPCFQCSVASRQPTSTHGENGSFACGTCSPTKPMKGKPSLRSTAHKPQPRQSISAAHLSAVASLSARERRVGKNSMTRGSAPIRAKGSLSASAQRRSRRRDVSNSRISGKASASSVENTPSLRPTQSPLRIGTPCRKRLKALLQRPFGVC